MNRKDITKALKYHLRMWNYEPEEVQANFHQDVRKYIAFKTKMYPALSLK